MGRLLKWVMCGWALTLCVSASAQQIDWWVVNRFPLFANDQDFINIETAWSKDLSAAATINTSGFTRNIAPHLPIQATAWQPDAGVYNKALLFRDTHDVRAKLMGVPPGTSCSWLVNGAAFDATDCSESPVLKVKAHAPFQITATPAGGAAVVLDVPAIQEHLIVALGDSFASGEGNPDHPAVLQPKHAGQDWFTKSDAHIFIKQGAQWWDEACHRSLLSWPALAALGRAIEYRKEVTQFASFACSGAEVYDGVLRAQADPPGKNSPYQVGLSGRRDGGAGYRFSSRRNGGFEQPQIYRKRLRLSQQHALADLLCEAGTVKEIGQRVVPAVQSGSYLAQTYFGDVTLYGCTGPKRHVDNLLVSIGGNDVGFSGVVTWLLLPATARGYLLKPIRQAGLDFVQNLLHVTTPEAAKTGLTQLPGLYEVFSETLRGLGIEGQSIKLLQYPDPTAGGGETIEACEMRTRDGNTPMELVMREKTKSLFSRGNSNFLFGINPDDYRRVNHDFIEPLRQVQELTASKYNWQLIDSQLALRSSDGIGHGYCAVSASCGSEGCSSGDRVKWWSHPESFSDAPAWTLLSEFDPYDATRARGLRYGVDALLTSVALASKHKIKNDWITGSIHPTANVHAQIADNVRQVGRQEEAASRADSTVTKTEAAR